MEDVGRDTRHHDQSIFVFFGRRVKRLKRKRRQVKVLFLGGEEERSKNLSCGEWMSAWEHSSQTWSCSSSSSPPQLPSTATASSTSRLLARPPKPSGLAGKFAALL